MRTTYSAAGSAYWLNTTYETIWQNLLDLKLHVSMDLAVLYLGFYLTNIFAYTQNDKYMGLITTASLIITKYWKERKCP